MPRAITLALVLVLSLVTPDVALAQREVTPEARIFRELRDGVFTVFGDGGHGSGFLVHRDGLVLTNQHVVANSKYIRVQLNDSVKVMATLLAENVGKDVAILRISPEVLASLPVLPLAAPREELAFEGERVIAIGSPLNQTKIITSGIVSKVEKTAIISDVNINPGNSGGPLINLDGEVIAINTFGDETRSGPGVSGSVAIYEVREALEHAFERLAATAAPPPDRLPVMPREIFPLGALEAAAIALQWDEAAYDVSRVSQYGTGNFVVSVHTPPYLYRVQKKLELELAQRRQERESAAGASQAESYSPFDDLRAWAQYTGFYAPVVILRIAPRVGETTGSTIANLLGAAAAGYSGTGYRGTHNLEFKGDLKDVTITRNEQPAVEISRGMTFVPLVVAESNYWASYYGKDLARAGVLVLSPTLFEPAAGQWPTVSLTLEDLKKPGRPQHVVLPQRTVERIWADFAPYREQLAADRVPLQLPIQR